MPEVHVALRWPDGELQRLTSPSTVIERALVQGGRYPVTEFARRAAAALDAGSERVRAKYGFACTAAAAAKDAVQARAATSPDGHVVVERLQRARPQRRFPAPERLEGHVPVVVIGGGQAGLAVSRCLGERGVEHLVLERDVLASAWRTQRWDAFCLVTPNFQCRLPGHPYRGPEPDGFMVRDEIVAYVEGFAAAFAPPLYEGVTVERVEPGAEAPLRIVTSHGELTADEVVLAVGGYHVPAIPRLAERLPEHLTQLHSAGYRNPSSLPDGAVLVVGSGQSGAQIAEDLHLAGRAVHLCVGTAPRVSRFYRGRDIVAWLEDIGHYDLPITEHPQGLAARKEANHYVTGRDGGRDIDLRRFALEGMTLHGRLTAAHDGVLATAGDLGADLDAADATNDRIKDTIDRYISVHGIAAPPEDRGAPVWAPDGDAPGTLDLAAAGITSVVWATGFRSDWSWVHLPAFDGAGYPTHHRGVTTVPGLSVLGLPWLHTWGSGRFAGVARDAEHLAGHIAGRLELQAAA